MDIKEAKQIRDSILTIDATVQKYLYNLHPKTVDKWHDTKMDIDKIVQKEMGKSVYGYWE